MDENEDIKCDQCGEMFQSSSEVQTSIKHCPECVEKNQVEMLRLMFGDRDDQN